MPIAAGSDFEGPGVPGCCGAIAQGCGRFVDISHHKADVVRGSAAPCIGQRIVKHELYIVVAVRHLHVHLI
jgi:hypothetical protein